MSEPQYKISACYFPKAGEVELTWEQTWGEKKSVMLTFKATPEQGNALVEVVDPCVYYDAMLAEKSKP